MPLVYLDTCIFIAVFEAVGPVSEPLVRLFTAFERKPGIAVTSELTLAELLAPIKRQPWDIEDRRQATYLTLFDDGHFIDLQPVSRSILLTTTIVRRETPQRLPDAIHIATALEVGCRFFMSSDEDAKRLPSAMRWMTSAIDDVLEMLRLLDA